MPMKSKDMIEALVHHGPSPEYGTSYYYMEGSITAISGDSLFSFPNRTLNIARTLLDRIFNINRQVQTPALHAECIISSLPHCETPFRKPRRSKIASIVTRLQKSIDPKHFKMNQLSLFGTCEYSRKDQGHEPYTKTTRGSRTHPKVQTREWVLPNNARARGRAWHQQGHRLRTNRSTHSQRLFSSRTKQSTLFIDSR